MGYFNIVRIGEKWEWKILTSYAGKLIKRELLKQVLLYINSLSQCVCILTCLFYKIVFNHKHKKLARMQSNSNSRKKLFFSFCCKGVRVQEWSVIEIKLDTLKYSFCEYLVAGAYMKSNGFNLTF